MKPAQAAGSLTLQAFLTGLFPANTSPRTIHLCAFPGDPHNKLTADWRGTRHKPFPYSFPDDCNQYFCVGLLDPATHVRNAAAVIRSPVIGLDDIGTKVPASRVRAQLTAHGVRPTCVLETSPGNMSLYYSCFDGDQHQMAAARERIKELGLSDPACLDPARYMRLPFGINGKVPGGWRVKLIGWSPQHTTPFAEFEAALWPGEAAGAAMRHVVQRQFQSGDLDRMARMDDPLVQLAREVGLDPRVIRAGVIEADCPFGDDHSSGVPDGFAFVNWGRCHCHHGHCIDRNSGDFRDKMVAMYDEQIALGLLDGSLMPTANDTMVRRLDGELVPISGHGFLSIAAFELIGDNPRIAAGLIDAYDHQAELAAEHQAGGFGNAKH